jgi:hypothetical protein
MKKFQNPAANTITMPRQSTLELPGSLYYVMARGIHRQDIFNDKKDLTHFRDCLGDLISQSSNQYLAGVWKKTIFTCGKISE